MKYFTSLFLFCAVTLPQFVLAQDPAPDGLVTCKDGGNCNFCDFTEMVRIINIWLLVIVGLIAVILFMYAGYRITSSRGDVGIVTEGRKLIGNVAIGIFIIILATTIIDVIMQTATGKDFGVWNRPPDCGESFKNTGLNTDGIKLETTTGVVIPPDPNAGQPGFDNSGFISAPYPGEAQYGSNNTTNNNGFGNDSLGEFGNTTVGNSDNNGFGNDPLGEFGDGTAGNPNSVYVAPMYGPQ